MHRHRTGAIVMAIGKKTGGNDFKPGHKHGKGRPALPEDLKKMKPISPDVIKRLIVEFGEMNREQLANKLRDPSTTMLEMMVGSVMAKAAKDACPQRFGFLLDRCIGKVKEQIDVNFKPVITFETNIRPDGTLLQTVIEAEVLSDGKQSKPNNKN